MIRPIKQQSLNPKTQWKQKLVGLTDSDDLYPFTIEKKKGNFSLKYSISQPFYNIKLLYFIKKILGYGKVLKIETRNLAVFTIRDIKVLKEIIFPIFDNYSLLTRKYFSYLQFKEAFFILENKNLTHEQKNESIENLLKRPIDNNNNISPIISHLNENSSSDSIKSVISKYWLTGFIEGKGNFNVFSEQIGFNVEFSIQIKKEKVLLHLIKRIFHIPNKVIIDQSGYYTLKTKQSRAISNIINAFSTQDCKFKGIKSLYFKLCNRAFYYKHRKIKKVAKIYLIIQKLHKKMNYV